MYNAFGVPHIVIEHKDFIELKDSTKNLYTILCKLANRYANKDGYFWQSNKKLMEACGKDEKTIITSKKELEGLGLISKQVTVFTNNRNKKATIYKITHWEHIKSDED